MADEAERHGVVLSGTTLKSAEAFNDNLTRLEGVAGGVMKQLTAGLLPALQAISQSFVDSASTGDGFVETGDAIGMVLVKVAGIALQAGAVLKAFGLIIGAVAAAAANPLGAREVFEALFEDNDRLGRETDQNIAKIDANLQKFRAAAASGAPEDTASGGTASAALKAAAALEAAEKARREAAAAAAEAKAEADRKAKIAAEELARVERTHAAAASALVDIYKDQDKVLDDLGAQQKRYREETEAATKAQEDLIRALDPAGAALDDYFTKLAQIEELYASGTIGVDQYERALANMKDSLGKSGDAGKKAKTEPVDPERRLRAVFPEPRERHGRRRGLVQPHGGADHRGACSASWAKKYIIDTVGAFFGLTPAATGKVFDAGAVVPFARGGVISQLDHVPDGACGRGRPRGNRPAAPHSFRRPRSPCAAATAPDHDQQQRAERGGRDPLDAARPGDHRRTGQGFARGRRPARG